MTDPRLSLRPLSLRRYLPRKLCGATLVLSLCILSGGTMLGQSNQAAPQGSDAQAPAQQFVREVVKNEINAQNNDHSHWKYRELREQGGKRELLEVVQTQWGQVYRLLEVNGEPLAGQQLEEEDRRIQRFLDHPQEIRNAQRKRIEDGEQAQRLLKIFPTAFQFRYDESSGATTRLAFTPDPAFRPTDHPSEVFHHMEGTMLVDSRAKRVVQIDAHLTSKVKFGGGMLGHLDKGGTFCVKQSDVGSGHWDVTLLDIHMDGKALFFKTVAVRQKETYSDYQPVPANVTPQQVAQLLTEHKNTSPKALPFQGTDRRP
jgi:hypothetical protein